MGFFDRLFGSAGTCGKNLRWELDGDTLTISGTGDMELYGFVGEIPWYDKRKSIRRIVIEDGVKTISYYAFVGCENLTSVTIGNSVTTIDSHAFTDCKRLTNVTIGNSVTTIDGWAFERCENLTSITIPDSVTTIDSYIFRGCTSLKEIHYPAGRGFEEHLSEGNNAKLIPYNVTPPAEKPKTQSVNKPKNPNGTCGKNLRWELDGDTLTISGRGDMENYNNQRNCFAPWYEFKAIKKVVINDGVTTIGNSAFDGCAILTEIKLPNSITKIGNGAFNFCWNLEEAIIPDGVTTINDVAFAGCWNLKHVTIPASVVDIGKWVFNSCEELKTVTIPANVTKMGDGVFGGCMRLKEIHYPAGRGFEKNLSMGNKAKLIPYNVTPTPQQKFYPVQSTTKSVAEKLTWNFTGKTLTVGGVREIKCFPYEKIPWVDHLNQVQKIVIGNGVEKISAHAFDECTRLEILELPASVKTIGDFAFTVCYCGGNGIKNVFWCLEDGVLVLKKNPDAPRNADFSTGAVSWIFAEKNITGVKLETGVVPTEKYYKWLAQRTNGAQISFG